MRHRLTRSGPWAVLALAVLLVACASTGGQADGTYARLVIENSSPLTVRVFAVVQTIEHRLGTVNGLMREEFALRQDMLDGGGVLRVRVQPMGGYQPYFSEPIPVSEGDVVELEVSEFIR